MTSDPEKPLDDYEDGVLPPSVYDAPQTPEEELWFLPGPPEDFAPGDSPLLFANRSHLQGALNWNAAERSQYRALVSAAEAVARFGARMAALPPDVMERIALQTVSAVLRAEGVWLNPEHIALFRALRASSQDQTRDLERASWAVRRLIALRHGGVLDEGLHAFLGRRKQRDASELLGDDQPMGAELDEMGEEWRRKIQEAGDLHRLTRAACGLFLWRRLEITPIDAALEPMIAAGLLGAGDSAPFLPLPEGMPQIYAHAKDPAEALGRFYATVEQGALAAMLEMDRLVNWRKKAQGVTSDLSGKTPRSVIDTALRFPVFSAELAARMAQSSNMSARRSLNLLQDRGLLKEVTGQQRYRFWAARL